MTSAFGGQRSIQLSYGCVCAVYRTTNTLMQSPISGKQLVTEFQCINQLIHVFARVIHRK